MPLVSASELFKDAEKHHYAVGAFNVLNLEMVKAVINAAETEKSPVIVQLWHGDLAYAGEAYIGAIVSTASELCTLPIALQLDHGKSIDQVKSCISSGFTSVMIDLSSEDFSKNVALTKEVVRYAHAHGVSVEAEVGKIFSGKESVEKQKSALTDPETAARFAKETGIDALAVSVGTAHGMYTYGPDIDFQLLQELIQTIKLPMVIHGASGIPVDDIRKIVKLGVKKINVGTELMETFAQGLREGFVQRDMFLPVKQILGNAQNHLFQAVQKYIRLFNTYKM